MAEGNPQLPGARSSTDDPSATVKSGDQTIAQAAQAVGVSPSTIRLWERQGLIRARRTPAGHRRFGRLEIERIRSVRALHEARRTPVHKLVVPLAPAPSSDVSWLPASPLNQVGVRIRQVRWQQQLSLRELARRADVSASHLSSIERGHAQASVVALQKVTTALGVTLAALLAETTPEWTLVRSQKRDSPRVKARGVEIMNGAPTAKLLEAQLFTLAPAPAAAAPTGTKVRSSSTCFRAVSSSGWREGSDTWRRPAIRSASPVAEHVAGAIPDDVLLDWSGSTPRAAF
jgi:transcriptional regulator with XRE-family HTH domain